MLSLLLLSAVAAQAATPFAAYQNRVAQAAATGAKLRGEASGEQEKLQVLAGIKRLLPVREEVEFFGQTVRVDNSWLHTAADALSLDKKERAGQLQAIAARLAALAERLDAVWKTAPNAAAERVQAAERLQRILARPEYQPEEERASVIQQWLRKLWNWFVELLERLTLTAQPPRPAPGQHSLNFIRILLVSVMAAVAVFALGKLLRHFRRRPKRARQAAVREVLGEELAEEITAADLLGKAGELARQGDYRTAIRRAYLALLHELEQRGKLRLHRAKTNRDYLEDLRAEPALLPPVAKLTTAFERVWYGHVPASARDFDGFLAAYREAVKG